MTELNPSTGTGPTGEAARVSWPAMPEQPGEATGRAPSADERVAALLERLSDLPELPVAAHGQMYDSLHEDLLVALNESVTTEAPEDDAHEQA